MQSSFVLFSHRPVLDAIVLSLTVAVFCFSFNFLGSWARYLDVLVSPSGIGLGARPQVEA